MSQFLTYTIIGLCAAGTFAIAAGGLVLTYTTTGIFNFAHGATAMLGAFAYWQLRSPDAWNLPAPLALFLVIFVLAPIFGFLIEVVIMRRLQGASEAAKIVVSISLLAGMLALGQWVWSPDNPHTAQPFFEGSNVHLLGVNVSWHEVIGLLLAIVVAVGLRILLYRTRAGIAMRASVDDRGLAALHGARPDRSAMLAWAIGSSLAAMAGILTAGLQGLNHTYLTLLIVNAYAAALLGRLKSLPMTFLGAVILGLADSYATAYIPSERVYLAQIRPAVPIILLFIVLLVLPSAKLRGHVAKSTQERMPRPTWGRTLVGCGFFILLAVQLANWASPADAQTLTKMFGLSLIAASLVPLIGWAGQMSLCSMSFAAIGALAMGHQGGGGHWKGLIFAAVLAGLAGALVSLPALRLSGIYLALATAAFAVVLDRWIFLLPPIPLRGTPWKAVLFGSSNLGVDPLHLPGVDTTQPRTMLVMLACVFVVFAIVLTALRRSVFGERLLALKDSPAACATLGMNVNRTKLAVFTLSAAMAGLGGAFYGASLQSVSSSNFDFFASLPIALLVVVGGVGTVWGAFFVGLTQIATPMALARFNFLTKPLTLLPALLGITIARSPNGVAGEFSEGFAPLRRRPERERLAYGIIAVLTVAQILLGNTFPVRIEVPLAIAVLLGIGLYTKSQEERAAEQAALEGNVDPMAVATELPLEWIGVDRPFTLEDEAAMNKVLALPRAEA